MLDLDFMSFRVRLRANFQLIREFRVWIASCSRSCSFKISLDFGLLRLFSFCLFRFGLLRFRLCLVGRTEKWLGEEKSRRMENMFLPSIDVLGRKDGKVDNFFSHPLLDIVEKSRGKKIKEN